MRVCIIDGQGGGLGRRLVRGLLADLGRDHELIGLGTNQAAADAMGKAGAERTGVGPDVITEAVQTADVILTSLNVLLPDSRQGELTPEVIQTILEAKGTKILLPVNRFRVEVAGTESHKLEQLIQNSLSRVRSLVGVVSLT